MPNLTRQEIFAQASQKLRSGFQELKLIPHRGVKGGEAENLVKMFLKQHLPKRFDVGSGFILDPFNNVSRQTDVIIYDAANCPVYRASDDAGIFPSVNVAAVVEVKSRLTKDELVDAFKNIMATKQLAKAQLPDNAFMTTSQTLGCLFAFGSAISLDKISEHYFELLHENGIGHHIDLILVLDEGTITMWSRPRGFDAWGFYLHEGTGGPLSEGMGLSLAIEEFGVDSLDAFLRYMLTHLSMFRGMVDHPGLNWSANPAYKGTKLRFVAAVTRETDPDLKRQLEQQYAKEFREEFAKMRRPDSEP